VTLGVMTAQLVDAAGAALGLPFPVTHSAPPQRHQEVAWNGQEFLVVWSEATGLFMGRLTADGNPIDGRGVQIANEDAAPLGFAVAFDGHAFIITWTDVSALFAQRVRSDGAVDGTPVIVGEQSRPYFINRALPATVAEAASWHGSTVVRCAARCFAMACRRLPPNSSRSPNMLPSLRSSSMAATTSLPWRHRSLLRHRVHGTVYPLAAMSGCFA